MIARFVPLVRHVRPGGGGGVAAWDIARFARFNITGGIALGRLDDAGGSSSAPCFRTSAATSRRSSSSSSPSRSCRWCSSTSRRRARAEAVASRRLSAGCRCARRTQQPLRQFAHVHRVARIIRGFKPESRSPFLARECRWKPKLRAPCGAVRATRYRARAPYWALDAQRGPNPERQMTDELVDEPVHFCAGRLRRTLRDRERSPLLHTPLMAGPTPSAASRWWASLVVAGSEYSTLATTWNDRRALREHQHGGRLLDHRPHAQDVQEQGSEAAEPKKS